jgi:hypothetical protein
LRDQVTTVLLDASGLLADAEHATGFTDWGGKATFEDSFRRLFASMVDSINKEARLTPSGVCGAERRLRAMAESRLRFVNDRQKWPAISNECILRPIFILGLPRSGSTFLHSLMAQDPANRHPRTWEMMLPSPPPALSSYDNDPRIEQAQALLRAMGLERPDVTALHPFGARQPEECHLLMELMGLGDNLPALWRIPSFNRVRATIDMCQGYWMHRMALQNLQYRYKCERWLLKNPGHIFYLDHLLAVYPDARIIQTHRDPARVLPSVTALLLAMRQANSDEPNSGEKIAMGNLKAFAGGLEKAIEFRRQAGMEQHFHDVHFRALIADPIGTVRQIYQRFGLTLEPPAVERMQAWLGSHDSHSGKTRYTLEQYGLDQSLINNSFGSYMAQYLIAPERKAR